MSDSLKQWGIAVLVLGASLFVLPYFNLPIPGPPNVGFYIAVVGAGMWILGRAMK